jgi:uncharacterized protein (TIGR02145 family)
MIKTYNILLSFFLILISGMGFSQSVPSYVPTNGLVGWWGFNGNAQDGSGNGNHGTVNGATLTTDRFGNQNGAYSFDGIDDYCNLNSQLPNSFSISLWTAIDSFKVYHGISSELLSTFNQNFLSSGFVFRTDAIPNKIVSGFWNTNGNQIVSKNNIQQFQWNHYLVHYSSGILNLYFNGIICDSKAGTYVQNNQNIFLAARQVYQGNNPAFFADCTLDDIGIWNRALTPQEITNLYNSQLPTQTSLCLPTITTSSPSSVGVDTVVIGGDISNDGGSSIVLRGICYSTSPNPNMGNQRTEDGSGTGSFNTVLRGLASSTAYYARSYAKNSNGVVVYGNEVSFTTSASLPGVRCPGTPTVTDIDGNIYNTVQIGNQCWTQSNLKTSRYRNGDVISNFFYYGDNPQNDVIFGKLYQHSSVTDFRGLCPTGWHVPSNGEWNTLINFLGGSSLAGGALKSTHIQPTIGGWSSPNTGATNSTGFTGLPGGYRNANGSYGSTLFNGGYWWTSTVTITNNSAAIKIMENINSSVRTVSTFISEHASIRCVVD